MPERDAGIRTTTVPNRMSVRERCARRNYCYLEIYKKCVQTSGKRIRALVGGLEPAATTRVGGAATNKNEAPRDSLQRDLIANRGCNNM